MDKLVNSFKTEEQSLKTLVQELAKLQKIQQELKIKVNELGNGTTERTLLKKEYQNESLKLEEIKKEIIENVIKKDYEERSESMRLIEKISYPFAFKILQRVIAQSYFYDCTEIKAVYQIPDTEEIKIFEKEKGITYGLIVETKDMRIYVKEFWNQVLNENGMDPAELLVYKVLEYCGFGPKVKILLNLNKASEAGEMICHVCSKDASFSKKQDTKKSFITDSYDDKNSFDFENNIYIWEQAINDENFCIDLLALSVLDDVFLLGDTFNNPENYGVIKSEKKLEEGLGTKITFKPKIVDHLPSSKYRAFDYKTLEESVESFFDKIKACYERRNKTRSKTSISYFLCINTLDNIKEKFKGLTNSAVKRLLYGKRYLGILEATNQAKKDVEVFIENFPCAFVPNAVNVLKDYYDIRLRNIEKLTAMYVNNT
jgi:hypothetical protein